MEPIVYMDIYTILICDIIECSFTLHLKLASFVYAFEKATCNILLTMLVDGVIEFVHVYNHR